MAATRRLSQLLDRLFSRVDLPEGDLVVGLSGGADSAALAFVIRHTGREARLLHVDHGLPASHRMREAALAVADQLDHELDIVEVEVLTGPSPEAMARAARYAAFEKAAPPPTTVLTAHTRDDQAETVVMNLLRGAGLRGMAGIPVFRPPNIHRPFLEVSRSETREIATLAALRFLDDPMNEDPGLRRNVVRREVLPSLGRFNPRLVESLARLAAAATADSAFLDRLTEEILPPHSELETRVPLGSLLAADRVLANRVVASVIRSIRGDGPTAGELTRVGGVVEGVSARAELGSGVSVFRDGPMLVVTADQTTGDEAQQLELPIGSHRLGRFVLDVEEHHEVCRVAPIGAGWAIFPATTALSASFRSDAEIVVSADGVPAWTVGVERHPVAYYRPGATGYLSVLATEESDEWTSRP